MNLTEIYRGSRRSDPTILWVFKLFIMITIVACLSGYFAIIMIDIDQDEPIIISSLKDSVNSSQVPYVIFYSVYPFRLVYCAEVYKVNDTNSQKDCASFFIQPDYDVERIAAFGSYSPPLDSKFTFNTTENSLTRMTLGVQFYGEISPDVRPLNILVIGSDSEMQRYTDLMKAKKYKDLYSLVTLSADSTPFEKSLISKNTYALMLNELYQVRYSNKEKEIITPSWLNNFGVPPNYKKVQFIETTLIGDKLPEFNGIKNVFVELNAVSPVIEVQKEVRTHTFIGDLGLIGGAWGLAVGMYAFLFGTDALRPWGIVQLFCCRFSRLTKNRLKETLPVIPFFDTTNPDPSSRSAMNKLSIAEQYESRLVALELFLQEHIINTNYLDEIRNMNVSSRVSNLNSFTSGPIKNNTDGSDGFSDTATVTAK